MTQFKDTEQGYQQAISIAFEDLFNRPYSLGRTFQGEFRDLYFNTMVQIMDERGFPSNASPSEVEHQFKVETDLSPDSWAEGYINTYDVMNLKTATADDYFEGNMDGHLISFMKERQDNLIFDADFVDDPVEYSEKFPGVLAFEAALYEAVSDHWDEFCRALEEMIDMKDVIEAAEQEGVSTLDPDNIDFEVVKVRPHGSYIHAANRFYQTEVEGLGMKQFFDRHDIVELLVNGGYVYGDIKIHGLHVDEE